VKKGRRTAQVARNPGDSGRRRRDHVVICGFGRVGQNIARVLEQTGFEFIALELDAYRIRAGRQAGDPVIYGDAGEVKMLEKRRRWRMQAAW